MSAITRLLAEREFASIDEANAYLQEVLAAGDLRGGGPQRRRWRRRRSCSTKRWRPR